MNNFFSIQINFNQLAKDFLSSVVLKNIDSNTFAYTENKSLGGLQTTDAHITICYGLENEIPFSDSIDFTYEEIGSLGYIDIPEYGAKALVAFPKFHNEFYSNLHDKYLPYVSKKIEIRPYKPHITLAYLKGDAVIDLNAILLEVSEKKLEFDSIVCIF